MNNEAIKLIESAVAMLEQGDDRDRTLAGVLLFALALHTMDATGQAYDELKRVANSVLFNVN